MSGENQSDSFDNAMYIRQVEILETYANEASSSFDKTLVTLSSGALAISIASINQIAPNPIHVWLCSVSWILLAFSLISTLIAFVTSRKAMRREIDILYKAAENRNWYYSESNGWSTWTDCLNWFTLATFAFGIVFLTVFATSNALNKSAGDSSGPINQEENFMPNDENQKTEPTKPDNTNHSGNSDVLEKAQTPPSRPYMSQTGEASSDSSTSNSSTQESQAPSQDQSSSEENPND